ncbi:hypothetical protein KDA08_03830 [Candidatus Saccharibacteria bacterium]|nr:hypothetical protein [Candidatus Saccharibacteria bacterium]
MKYMITSIQMGARLNKNFYSNMLKFKEEHGVDKILVFVMNGKYVDEVIHPSVASLPDIEFIDSTYRVHPKVLCYDTKVLAQNINPTQGQENKLPSEYSYIMPGTKRRYRTLPSIGTKPRFFASTGAMTEANYVTVARSSGMRVKRGLQAKAQHQLGFVYFQDNGRGNFDVYQVIADKGGNFQYLTEWYRGGRMINRGIEALVLGDWHTGDTNPEIRKRSIKMIETLKPKRVVFHDIFDGYSVNHHKQGKLLEALRTGNAQKHLLEEELKKLVKEIEYFANKFPKVKFIVPESNHDVFIRTYLDSMYHHAQPHNYLQAIKIIPRILDIKRIALKEALLTVTKKLPENFIFLRENDPYRIGGDVNGIALGQHGHKGINGARGSYNSFKRTNAKMITGHTHSPQIYENGMIVGTSTYLELDYTIGGLSSWLNAHGILYPNMTYGLLTMIPNKTKRT